MRERGTRSGPLRCFIQIPLGSRYVVWIIEESDDCGGHWRRAELIDSYAHPRSAMREAFEIIQVERRPNSVFVAPYSFRPRSRGSRPPTGPLKSDDLGIVPTRA